MATMHYLFFGLLLVALHGIGHTGHPAVTQWHLADSYRVFAAAHPQQRIVAASEAVLAHNSQKCWLAPGLRDRITDIAAGQLGVSEATGNNDGPHIEEYLAYTGLGKGYAWCAAFVSWCYGQAGLSAPRSPWSPALFPMARRYTAGQISRGLVRPADLFGIYNSRLRRIDHVGLVRNRQGPWLLTIEGNVDDRVLSKRRSLATIHAFANWLD